MAARHSPRFTYTSGLHTAEIHSPLAPQIATPDAYGAQIASATVNVTAAVTVTAILVTIIPVSGLRMH